MELHYYLDVNRWPEKLYPGRFDFLGMTSHAIWHVFVCFGIYVSFFFFFPLISIVSKYLLIYLSILVSLSCITGLLCPAVHVQLHSRLIDTHSKKKVHRHLSGLDLSWFCNVNFIRTSFFFLSRSLPHTPGSSYNYTKICHAPMLSIRLST